MICRNCGTELKDGEIFCHECGAKVLALSCPKCGAELIEGAKFCSLCGTNIKNDIPTNPIPVSSEAQPTSKKHFILLLVIIWKQLFIQFILIILK